MEDTAIIRFERENTVFHVCPLCGCGEASACEDGSSCFYLDRFTVKRYEKSDVPGSGAVLLTKGESDEVFVFICPTEAEIGENSGNARKETVEDVLNGLSWLQFCTSEYLIRAASFVDEHISKEKTTAFVFRDFDETVFPAQIVDEAVRILVGKDVDVFWLPYSTLPIPTSTD